MTALWRVGADARNFAFGVVALTCLYVVLWVSMGNGFHKDYETPTPVHGPSFIILRFNADTYFLVLVLDRFKVRCGALGR